jgi:hypothetical protein
MPKTFFRVALYLSFIPALVPGWSLAQTQAPAQPPAQAKPVVPYTPPVPPAVPKHADILRGEYGPYRANYDLLSYHLDIRVDPDRKFLSGKNTIRFKMLSDATRIQLDLHEALKIDKILLDTTPLKYERDSGAVFVDFPETLHT